MIDSIPTGIIAEIMHDQWCVCMKNLITTDKQFGYFRGDGNYIILSHRVRSIRRLMNLRYNELDDDDKKISIDNANKLLEIINE